MKKDFDAVVIGGGHAGIEASLALARLNFKTLMITQNLDTIGKLSCNPAIGGLAKGNLVREIDALGGEMGRIIDKTMIQFRILNRSRGPAVQAPRAQADRVAYQTLAKEILEKQENLTLYQDTVVDFILNEEKTKITGVITDRGKKVLCDVVVLTTGTFLAGKVFVGEYEAPQGRMAEPSALGLDKTLRDLGFEVGRLKTGTPCRVARDSLDFSQLEPQWGDEEMESFSFSEKDLDRPNLQCYITYTNAKTHDIIRENLHRSPLYSGKIIGNGPRYCPSIEDKVVKFPDRERHQVFIEPEGTRTGEMYLNGISSSLPEEVQEAFIHSIPGLEKAEIMRVGYAVEYDFINPNQLYPSLETKRVDSLFVAGQTNGTSGYEEAAAQGLMAGINAARKLQGKEPIVLSRSEAYIGVMIDDLVIKGTEDPYRMFTSRAEHRLHLRHDTSDRRLLRKGYDIGLISSEKLSSFENKMQKIESLKESLRNRRFKQVDTEALPEDSRLRSHHAKTFYQALKDPEVSLKDLLEVDSKFLEEPLPNEILSQVELDVKYEGYAARQEEIIRSHEKLESLKIPPRLDYNDIFGLSSEAREKLSSIKPFTVGQASRIAGIRSSDIAILIVALKKKDLPSLKGAV